MQTTYEHNFTTYTFSNENLNVGDRVYPISRGTAKEGVYTHEKFDFRDFMTGFFSDPHIIKNLHHSDDYKPYEISTDHGYGPVESYFKIIKKEYLEDTVSPQLHDYYKKKRLEAERKELGMMYVVYSDRDGVKDVQEFQIIELNPRIGNGESEGIGKYTYSRYVIDNTEFPYEIDIIDGEDSSIEEGYGTGTGDLWSWTYYFALNKEDAEEYFKKERVRVQKKYPSNKKLKNTAKISLIQIKTVSGDLDGNYKQIEDGVNKALLDDADIMVLPETAFTGYCAGALWDNIDFILDQEAKLNRLASIVPQNKCVIVGYVSYHGMKLDGFPYLKNSVAVINQNKIERYDKQLLANADHHEDRKYFKPGKESKVFDIVLEGITMKIGVPICEDAWYIDHARDIPNEMVKMGAEMLISINQSYFYYGKQSIRETLFKTISSRHKIPVVAVNAVGVGDIVKNIIVYDGSSMVYSANGYKVCQLKRFNPDQIDVLYDRVQDFKISGRPNRIENNKFDEIIDAVVFSQKELFGLLGMKNAQVHVSGGIDSAIVMTLSLLSMGKENCVFITNPTSLNSDSLPLVNQLAENLGVQMHTNELEEIYQTFKKKDTENFGSELNPTGQATIQAVLRTVQGLASCHRFKSGIVACGNHTEIVLGWASFHDIGSIGVFSPIGDLTKLELFELCTHINKRFHSMGYCEHVIPEDLFNGMIKPAAELPDSKYDPIDYYIQSGLCAELIRLRKTKRQLILDFENKTLTKDFFPSDIYEKYSKEQFEKEVIFTISKSQISVFKAAQGAPILILSPRSRGFSNRETIINKYKQI